MFHRADKRNAHPKEFHLGESQQCERTRKYYHDSRAVMSRMLSHVPYSSRSELHDCQHDVIITIPQTHDDLGHVV